jgi:hypothetical protein
VIADEVTDGEAIEARHVDVEDGERHRLTPEQLPGARSILGDDGLVTEVRDDCGVESASDGVVVSEENAHAVRDG